MGSAVLLRDDFDELDLRRQVLKLVYLVSEAWSRILTQCQHCVMLRLFLCMCKLHFVLLGGRGTSCCIGLAM